MSLYGLGEDPSRGSRRRRLHLMAGALLAASALGVAGGPSRAAAQEGDRGTITMREKVYGKLSRAQEAAEAEDYAKAFEILADVEKMKDLEPYEKAQLYTAYGYIYFSQEKYSESIDAYAKVLQQENLPEAMQSSTRYTLAQLLFQAGDYERAIGYLEQWLENATNPGPEPLVLLGQGYYQLSRYREAIAPVQRAIAIAEERGRPADENWYLLLRASYYELEDYPRLLEVLEILVTKFSGKKEYWIHLASAYGAMGDEDRQLAAYEIAYEQGYLDSSRELVLFAQLLLQAEVPYQAGVVLEKALRAGSVEATAENYRLLSQAWMLAQEAARTIEALTKAAELSSDGELDARLAQAYANLDDWEKAIETARAALRKGVRDAHEVQILLGMALFELERYDEAMAAFRTAQAAPEGRKAASQWITYIEREQERLRQLEGSLE